MRVTVCFGQTRVIVPCKGGATVAELVKEACARYKKATGKSTKYRVKIKQIENAIDGGILDVDDYVYDVAEDRDQLIAIFEEEDEQSSHYNGWDHLSGSGSDGHRSPLSFQRHQGLNSRFSDEPSPANRGRSNSKAPTGNATVIKHDNGDQDLEIIVGVEALKSSSNSNITVRDPMVDNGQDRRRSRSPMKKSSAIPHHYYGRRESGSGQEEAPHLAERESKQAQMRISTNSSPNQNVSVVATDISIDSGHHSSSKYQIDDSRNYSNFVRGPTRQSINGMLSGHDEEKNQYSGSREPPDGGKQNALDYNDCGGTFPIEHYLPPPPKDASIYPRFYTDSQEIFVDIDNRRLGIKVTSYNENKVFLGLLVESVDKGGRSEKEGLLQQGDIVVEINNYILAQYSLSVAQEIFKDAMTLPELQLRFYPIEERERTVSYGNTAATTVETNNALNRHRHTPSIPVISLLEPTPPKESRISAAKSLPDLTASLTDKSDQDASPAGKLPLVARMSLDTLSNNTRKIGDMLEIELKKGEQGLGFSITTRDTPVGDPGPIYIKNILPKGAAIQDGRLHAGDRLLKVDDIEITGHTQESAVNILRCIEVGSFAKLVVSRHIHTLPRKMKDDPAADKVLSDDSNKEYLKFEIALNDTGSAGLGISLKGNQSKKTKKDLGIFVKSVFHGGAAYQDGRLHPNDQLVSVNGQSLAEMTNHEAIDTLRTSMSTVGNVRGMIQMVIARRKNTTSGDPTSPQFSSEASSEISDSLVNEKHSRTSLEITGNSREEYSREDSFHYAEEIPRQIDPNPMHGYDNDIQDQTQEGDWTPSPDPADPNADPFLRESVFRQSISEKRKGAASRDAQNTDTFKALKNKQMSTEIEKELASTDSRQSTPSTPLKWYKPTSAKTNHSTNSTPSTQTPKSSSQRSPILTRRNLNTSSNVPATDSEPQQKESSSDVSRSRTPISFENRSATPSVLSQSSSAPVYYPPKPKLRRQLPKLLEPLSYSSIAETPKSSKAPLEHYLSSDSDSAPLPVLRKSNSSDSLTTFGLYSNQPPVVSPLKSSKPTINKSQANKCVSYLKPSARVEEYSLQPDVEVGPTLGFAKSSSLESLQTAVENYMEMQEGPFPKPQPRVLRGRVFNESFRAALDQSYDMDNLTGKPMTTLREEGDSRNGVSSLAKASDGATVRPHEKKRAGKSYKFFGMFRVGKSKRSLSSDRNLDSHSSSSSSPRISESEVHKKLLEAKREDDFKKHQAETERIQAKARVLRERQQEQRKTNDEHYKSREDITGPEVRVRAPSVPVTAMQRINIDPKVSYPEAPSGRRSVDPTAMRNSHPSTFEWQTSKRPTSPVDYSNRSRQKKPERKSKGNKTKITPDYSSLPRQPCLEPDARTLPHNPDRVLTNRKDQISQGTSPNQGSHIQEGRSAPIGSVFNNQEFYNTQKSPRSKKQLPEEKPNARTCERESRPGHTHRQGRSEKPKVGRTLYYDDTDDSVSPSSSSRSKTPQPRPRTRRVVSPKLKTPPNSTQNGFVFSNSGNSFHREESPEPPPVILRNPHQITSTPVSTSYRHSVHVDTPASRKIKHFRQPDTTRSCSQKQLEPPKFNWKTRIQRNDHDRSDSYRTASPTSSSSAEQNRNAVKKIVHQTRYDGKRASENIVISPPYNL